MDDMTGTPSLRERRRQMLHDEIIQAAQDLMGEKGHILMSMDELAARVGISKPTLYSYFDTKDALIVAAAMDKLGQVLEVLEETQSHHPPLQRLVLALKMIVQSQIDHKTMTLRPWTPELFAFLCEHEASYHLLDRIDTAIVALGRKSIEQGEIAADLDLAIVMRTFFALIHALNIGHKSKAGTPDPSTVADMLAKVFERGVRAGERG